MEKSILNVHTIFQLCKELGKKKDTYLRVLYK